MAVPFLSVGNRNSSPSTLSMLPFSTCPDSQWDKILASSTLTYPSLLGLEEVVREGVFGWVFLQPLPTALLFSFPEIPVYWHFLKKLAGFMVYLFSSTFNDCLERLFAIYYRHWSDRGRILVILQCCLLWLKYMLCVLNYAALSHIKAEFELSYLSQYFISWCRRN